MNKIMARYEGQLKVITYIVTIVTLPLLAGLGSWGLYTVVDHDTRIAVIETRSVLQKERESLRLKSRTSSLVNFAA